MRNFLPVVVAILWILCLLGSFACSRECAIVPLVSAPVSIIYDDDCDGDIDCVTTQVLINNWIDKGFVKMWGMVSSAPSKLGAPTMKVFRHYYNHDDLFSVGAWTPNCGSRNSAPWAIALVEKFDIGDVCTNYPSCGEILRKSIANYVAGGGATKGLVYVITGPLTCEEEFRTTTADAVSPLTGVEMEQQYIEKFVLMNGFAPDGLESNCLVNAPACNAFFANVTSENGYPPVYVVPLNTGATNVVTQIPASALPSTNPSAYAFVSTGSSAQTVDEDALAIEYGVFGGTGWRLSANSTNTVDATSGANRWSSSTASGQYYLTPTNGPQCFEKMFNVQWLSPGSMRSIGTSTTGESKTGN